MRKTIHRFVTWFPPAIGGGYALILGVSATAAAVNLSAKAFLDNQIVMLRAMISAPYAVLWILGIVVLWLFCFLWSSERQNVKKAELADSSPLRRTGLHISRATMDTVNGVNEACPDFPLESLVALIMPDFGESPIVRRDSRDWEKRINEKIADIVVEKQLTVWARWQGLPKDEIPHTTMKRAKFDYLNGQFTAFLPMDVELSVYTDVTFNNFQVESAFNGR